MSPFDLIFSFPRLLAAILLLWTSPMIPENPAGEELA